MRDILEPPNDWGHDQVAAFVDGCRNNVLASFQRCPEHYRKIVEVDTAFRDIAAQLLNPMSRAVPFFVLKAHSSFLGAAHLAMAGQTPESFMLMRGCLEAALYGLYLDRNPDTAAAWINRHDTDEERAACRNAFTTRKIFACLETTDPDTNRFASTLYERTIDLGAHPNVASLAIATTATRVDDRVQFRVAYLKHVIEDRDGYRHFYIKGQPVEREDDVHVMFDLVWLLSPSDVNREVNNGRGPADFAVSRGAADKTIVEFKIASNPQLNRNLKKQAEIYKQAARAQKTIKVIVFFTELQQAKVNSILRELNLDAAENVVLIDARADNKPSASKA